MNQYANSLQLAKVNVTCAPDILISAHTCMHHMEQYGVKVRGGPIQRNSTLRSSHYLIYGARSCRSPLTMNEKCSNFERSGFS